jgi:hypothetical protein
LQLLLENWRRSADPLPFQADIYFDTVGDLDKGNVAVHAVVFAMKRGTDPELLIDALNGPLFFRWLPGHAPLDKSFAEGIFDKVICVFQPE